MSTEHHTAVDSILSRLGVTFEIVREPNGITDITTRDNVWKCYAWRVRFKRAKVPEEFDYFTGIGHVTRKGFQGRHSHPTKPTAAALLYALLLDGDALGQSFHEWCGNFGSDSDSIKAFSTYCKCCEIGQQLRKLFSHAERAELSKALGDF